MPFTTFYTGYRQTVTRPDELIVGFEIPPMRGRQWFRKVGTRAAQAISKVVMAGVGQTADESAAHRVWQRRADRRSRCARPKRRSRRGASLAEAQRTLAAEIAPIDDIRSTADYRRRVAANLLAPFLERHADRDVK